jgi:NAD(P)-dependent dehydrogenase (short-subunit alcohol dehydrogenase family)
MSAKWTTEQIPDQSGRTAIVTGANSGLGLVCARELARHGASVVLACRNAEKGAAALAEIARVAPDAEVELASLDLGSLASVEAFAEQFRSTHDGFELLLNNAGVMAPPRQVTADGFEQAEQELIEHTSHGDEHNPARIMRDAADEGPLSEVSGEADEEHTAD